MLVSKIFSLFKAHAFLVTSVVLGATYFLLLTYVIDKTGGDFVNFLKEPFRWSFAVDRWFDWSSRFFIEDAVNLFTKHLLVWQVITVSLGAMLFWSIGRILDFRKAWQAIIIFSLFLFTNFYILTSAGIVATTINYLWPMACFAFVAAIYARPPLNKKVRIASLILSVPMLIFAVCNEQIAAFALALGVAVVAYMFYMKQRIPKILWVYIAIAVIGIVNALIAPGNAIRSAQNVIDWWPGFGDVPLQNKLAIGVITTFSRLLLAPEMMAIILIATLFVFAYKVKNKRAFISLVPAMSLLVLFFFPQITGNGTPMAMPNFFYGLRETAMTLAPDHLVSHEMAVVYLFLFAVIIVGMILSVYFLYGKTRRAYFMIILLGAGLAASLAVSLSPTLFASGTRTLYPVVMALLTVNAAVVVDIVQSHFRGRERTAPEVLAVKQWSIKSRSKISLSKKQ